MKPNRFKSWLRGWIGIDMAGSVSGQPLSKVAGEFVTPNGVLALSAVWACVSLLSETVATLPLGFYRRTANGRESADRHPLYWVLRQQPNRDMTAVQFWQAFVASMLLWGNGYAEKTVSGGQVISLELLMPEGVAWRVLESGAIEYTYTHRGKIRKIPEDRMLHIPALSTDGRNGLSPIAYGAQVFGGAQAANNAAMSTFEKGLMPTVAFKYPKTLKEGQRNEAREAIKKLSGALNAGNPVILEAETDAMTIGINPEDAQLLESRAFSIEEICRWFGVPPFMVGHSEKSTSWGTGIEQQMIGFVTFGLRRWLSRIEQGINRSLLTPEERRTHYAEFAIEGLLRGDSAARAAFYSAGLQNGWLNRNQVARLENYPEIPGGDIYTVQSNLVPLEQLGQPEAPKETQP
jgi:HK97 family phage portal protein